MTTNSRNYSREWKARNIEKVRAYNRQWNKDHPDRARDASFRWYHKDVTFRRARTAELRYGLSAEDRQKMLDKQGGLCAICRSVPPTTIDHDHHTNVVRGLLCNSCNLGIGWLNDDPDRCKLAEVYLRR